MPEVSSYDCGLKYHHATFRQKYYHAMSGLLIIVSLNCHHTACGCHNGIIMSLLSWVLLCHFTASESYKMVLTIWQFWFKFTIIRTQQATNKRPYKYICIITNTSRLNVQLFCSFVNTVTKWIKLFLLQCFGTFKMPILMFIGVLVFRPEGQI